MAIAQEHPHPLISIIVPIYEVDLYLRRCVDSILAQSYSNIEIILVDDGSPDNCPAICDEYANKDNRVRVLHKQNGGGSPSDARNAGLAIASGTLIGFVDGDDYIAPDMYEKLYSAMEKYDADIAICGYAMTDIEGNVKVSGAPELKDKVYSHKDVSPLAVLDLPTGCWMLVCNKLFKRNVVIPFPVNQRGEDIFVSYHAIDNCACIVTIRDDLYYYVQRDESFMHTFNISRLDVCDVKQKFFEFCKSNKLKRAGGYTLITTMFLCFLAFVQLKGKANRKKMWTYIRWFFIETLKHPTWFASVAWSEAIRYMKKTKALRA